MSKKEKLLPCPFCGSEAGIYGKEVFYVACTNVKECWCSLGEMYNPHGGEDHMFANEETAILYWNKRNSIVK